MSEPKVNPLDLSGRCMLVTGASSGIGRATAVLLGQLGAKLILTARSRGKLEETAALIEGSETHIEPFDLSQTEEIPGWLKSIAKNVGPFDGLVHSAGVHAYAPLRFLESADRDRVMTLNFEAGVQLAKGFRQRRVHAETSSLVFVSSVMGQVGQPGVSIYSASKGALIALSRSLALELVKEGIRVNCVAPGQVLTEMAEQQKQHLTEEQFADIEAMHPLGFGTPEDVAHGIAYLLAPMSRWVTGTTLVIDGGYTAH